MHIRQKSSEWIKKVTHNSYMTSRCHHGVPKTVEMQNFPAKYRLQCIIQTKLGEFQKNARVVKK